MNNISRVYVFKPSKELIEYILAMLLRYLCLRPDDFRQIHLHQFLYYITKAE